MNAQASEAWTAVAAAIPYFASSALSAALGFLAPLRRRGAPSGYIFQWSTLAIAAWLLCFGMLTISEDSSVALLWGRLGCVAVALVPASLYHFTVVALGVERQRRTALLVFWTAAVVMAILIAATDLVVSGLHHQWWGNYPRAGRGGAFLIAVIALTIGAAVAECRREYRNAHLWQHRTRMRAWVITFTIPFLALIDFVPSYGVPIYPLGFTSVLLFLFMAVYVFRKYWLVTITPSFAAKEIVETMADGVIVSDSAGRIQVVNRALLSLTGYSDAELTGQSLHLLLDPNTTLSDQSQLRRILSGENLPDRETIFIARDGHPIAVSLSVARVGDNQVSAGAVMIVRDIGERKDAEAILRTSEKRYRDLFERNLAGVFRAEPDGKVLDCNDAFARIFGYATREEVLSHDAAEFLGTAAEHNDALARLHETGFVTSQELRLRRRDGSEVWVLVNLSLGAADQRNVLEGTMFEISDLKLAQEKIEYQAYHDVLTDLPNRKLFIDRLEVAIARARRTKNTLAILFLDVDRFKMINDTFGHAGGDRVLLAVSDRLMNVIRAGDTVARFGGDEFALLVSEFRDPGDAAIVAQKILSNIEEPVLVDGRAVHLTASIGVALFPMDGEDAETLLKNADSAMYRAKESGRNIFQLCTDDMKHRAVERLTLEQNLRDAISNRELVLHYQPIVNLDQSKIIAVEALLRWKHRERGLLLPDKFMAVAEDSNLIVPIGKWVMRTAFEQITTWRKRGLADVGVVINLSARQFQQPDLLPTIEQLINETGIDPAAVELEITESTAMVHVARTVRLLHDLRQLGFAVALDDFGVGYSSLNYLKRLPIDAVKIDRSFIQDITTDEGDAAIIDAVVGIARTLKLRVVAEGIETDEQLEAVVARGCHEAQGYLFSEPLPAEELLPLIRSSRAAVDIMRAPRSKRAKTKRVSS